MADNTSYLTVYPEGETDPQSRQLLAGEGFAFNNGGGTGTYTFTLVSTGLLNSIVNLSSIGLLVKIDNENFVLRDLQTDSTINLVNDNGVSGNITLGVNDNTSNQRFNFQVNSGTIFTGNTLNVIPINGAGANLTANGDIINLTVTSPSSSGGAPSNSNYILQKSDIALENAQSLGALTTGLLKNTVSGGTGVLSTANPDLDYLAYSSILQNIANSIPATGNLLVGNNADYVPLPMGTLGQVFTVIPGELGNIVGWATPATGKAVYSGTTTLSGGSATVNLTGITGSSSVVVSYSEAPTSAGILSAACGTGSFNILSTNTQDDTTVSWIATL